MTRDVWDAPASVIRQLKLNTGARNATELAAIVNAATDSEREQMLNQADAPMQARLEHEQFQSSHGHLTERGADGGAYQLCPACGAYPAGSNGEPVPSPLRRWWCSIHQDQAADGDLEPWTPGYAIDPATGMWFDAEAQEIERQQAEREEQRRAAQHAARLAARQAEAAELGPDDAPLGDNLTWMS